MLILTPWGSNDSNQEVGFGSPLLEKPSGLRQKWYLGSGEKFRRWPEAERDAMGVTDAKFGCVASE